MNKNRDKIILLSGFEAFGAFSTNPSALLAEKFDGLAFGSYRVRSCILPVVFGEAPRLLEQKIGEWKPAIVVCLGQAAGRSGITPERIAVNIDDADMADNAGNRPVEKAVVPGGPAAYWSGLPVSKIVNALAALDIPASVSMSAGTYVCNHVFYSLMHKLAGMPGVKGGFVHIPLMEGQSPDDKPALSLHQMEQAVRCVLQTSVEELEGA